MGQDPKKGLVPISYAADVLSRAAYVPLCSCPAWSWIFFIAMTGLASRTWVKVLRTEENLIQQDERHCRPGRGLGLQGPPTTLRRRPRALTRSLTEIIPLRIRPRNNTERQGTKQALQNERGTEHREMLDLSSGRLPSVMPPRCTHKRMTDRQSKPPVAHCPKSKTHNRPKNNCCFPFLAASVRLVRPFIEHSIPSLDHF